MSIKAKLFSCKTLEDMSEHQFEGYASTFGSVDREGDIFEKGAFDKTINSRDILPLLFNHDRNSVIGKLEISSDSHGLFVKGYLNMSDPKAQNVYNLMKMGALDSMSIGFAVKQHEPTDVNRPFGGWKIQEAELYEVSVVTVPANSEALVTDVKAVKEALYFDEKKREILEQIRNIDKNINLLLEEII